MRERREERMRERREERGGNEKGGEIDFQNTCGLILVQ